MIAYFDTSAFVKLVVPERGSRDAIAAWLGAERIVSSLLLYPEARAAVARAVRMGRLHVGAGRSRLDRLWADVTRIDPTEPLAQRAGDLAEALALRGYDAVHLASMEAVPGSLLVTADAALVDAAQTLGFAVVPLPVA